MDKCCIEGCERLVYVKKFNFCRAHYLRYWRHGSPFIGATFVGDPQKFIDTVAVTCTDDECLIWPFGTNAYGYAMKGGVYVARFVCEKVHGSPPSRNYDCAHSCGKGHLGCVNPKHLSWKTRAENHADKVVHGTHRRGERSNLAKLSQEEVLEIKYSKTNQRITAELYGIDQSTVSDIRRGKSWAWL